MSTFTIPTIFTAVDRMSPVVAKMSMGVQTFAQKAEVGVARLDRRMRRLGPSIGGLGKQMLAFAATGAVIAGVRGAVNTIKDFEQANADLSAVMNTTAENQKKLLDDASRLGGSTAKTATEVVGLQEAYARLGFATDDIVNMTEATISGSIAMNAELADTAELTGAMIKTFSALESTDTTQVMDQMTLATQKSALNFEKLQTALPIVSKAADASGISFEEMSASLGILADGGIDASSSASALRNIYLDSAKRGVPYQKLLEKIAKSTDKLKLANQLFGKRGAVVAVTLAENIEKQQVLKTELEKTKAGQENANAAMDAAKKRADTLAGRLTLLGSAWDGILIKANNNTGALGVFNRLIEFVTENLETITVIVGSLTAAFLGLKTMLFLSKVALIGYNLYLGISSALSGTAAIAVGSNATALFAYNAMTKIVTATTKIWTGVQWAINAALSANPIGLLIIAIAALAAIMYVVIDRYDEFGASMTLSMGPIGHMINLIMSLTRNWDMLTTAFESDGIAGALKGIGVVIVDSILYPLEQALELLSMIPGLTIADDIAKDLAAFKLEHASMDSKVDAVNPKEAEQNALANKIETSTKSNATLTINDPNNRTAVDADADFPTVTTTRGGGSDW
jgi:hypothetical protein